MTSRVQLYEPARTYVSTYLLGLALGVGFAIDLATGGAIVHAYAWVGALIIVVGADAFSVRAARRLRSVTLTTDELRVGEHSIERGRISAVEPEVEPGVPILGRTALEGLPRGVAGVTLRLDDSSRITVPVRRPAPLIAALALDVEASEIRPADPDDLVQLDDIERGADQLFAVSGFGALPAGESREAVLVLVAGRPPVGFARLSIVDGAAHLDQLSVLPRFMRQGIGTSLVRAAEQWAKDASFAELTLTTFTEVAWNGPFYAHLGFEPIVEVTPGLAALRAAEARAGLDDLGPRTAMRKVL